MEEMLPFLYCPKLYGKKVRTTNAKNGLLEKSEAATVR
jgi:hypothetical protein